MKPEQKELVDSLRSFADFLERTELDFENAYFGLTEIYLFCANADSFLKNTKALGGFTREFNDYSAQVHKKFGVVKFTVHTARESVCEKVKVGVEVLPAEPEKIIPAKPERVVDKYEYKCPESLLSHA